MSTVDNRHVIAPAVLMADTIAWLEGRGYRAAVVPPVRTPTSSLPVLGAEPVISGYEVAGKVGVLYGRKNEPLFLAQVGDVLAWDGYCVKVEE